MGLSFGRQSPNLALGGEGDIRHWYKQVRTDDDIEQAIRKLLQMMTQREKIGQLTQISYGDQTLSLEIQNIIINGEVGSFLNCNGVDTINQMQKLSTEKSRLKIPQLIGKDVIHGFRTVLPIPLAQAASFDPEIVRQCARNAAEEASSTGIRWTFSPMVDIARDPRWGRIAQGCGEDPYLASVMGVAMCKGYQTDNLRDITAIAACGKHYVGYGATEGGRDYNTTLIPENTLRDIYLTPFQALAQNGCLSYMSAFNDLNGEPSSGNEFTLKQVLRKEWGFTGLVVSDYGSIAEMIVHGFCENEKDAALKGFNGGVDMEMVSQCYKKYLSTLVSEGKVKEEDVDTAVGNILRVKFKLGLFENSYTDPSRQSIILSEKFKLDAKELAVKCPVLLQNKNKTLPMSNGIRNLAIIGALADDGENQMGCWVPDGQDKDSITPLTSFKAALPGTNIMFAKGYKTCTSTDTSLIEEAVNVAKKSERILLFVGEDNELSGESNCRAFINMPGIQEQLINELAKLSIPIVMVVYAGRSLILTPYLDKVDSILYAWHLGSMAGPALCDLILGIRNPSGRLPVSFLRDQGQIPTYYNRKGTDKPNNSYIDCDSSALWNFGYGLSYNNLVIGELQLSKKQVQFGETLVASVEVTNDDDEFTSDSPLMLYIRDKVGSYTRPLIELKGFQRVKLLPGEGKTVSFQITSDMLRFWTMDNEYKAEPGTFDVWICTEAITGKPQDSFDLVLESQEEFTELI